MMSSSSNAALYPQYKRDTQAIALWLDKTSRAHGFTGSRNARKRMGAKKKYTISISDFRRMADFLSLIGHIVVPESFRTALSRVIRYRSDYGSYLQRQRHTNTPRDKLGDKNHLFFIDVLKWVQTVLVIYKAAAPVASATQTTATKPPPAANRFAILAVPQQATVEDDEEDHATTPVQTTESPEPSEDNVIFEPWQEDYEEALFLWRLFNVDVQRIRKQIRHLWSLYRNGHLGLAGAAVAHNMAIHVVRKLEQDIFPVFERYGGYESLSKTHFVQRYLGAAVDEEQMNARLGRLHIEDETIRSPTVDSIIDGFDIAEEEMVFAWQVLISEAGLWTRCGSFSSYNGKWGQFIPRDNRQNMTSLEKYNQDKAIGCGVIVDAQILAMFLNPSIGMTLDELSTAIEEVIPWSERDFLKRIGKEFPPFSHKITFRAVFATQLLLDSIHVLGTSIDRPWTELLDKTARTFKSAKSLREFYEGAGAMALAGIPGVSFIEGIESVAKFWQGKEDPITNFRREGSSTEIPLKTAGTSLRYHASLCGWWMQAVRALCHFRSIKIANSIALPLACARLYFVFVQEGLVPKGSWPDMDAFSILHRGDLWVGTAPKPGQYLQNLMVAGGNSIVGLASDARARSQPTRTGKFKTLTFSANVCDSIFSAFIDRKAGGMSEEDVERLIANTKLRWYNGKAVRPCFHHGWDKAGNYKKDKNPTSSETDNPFLRLAQAVDAETLEQSFDYMSLNRVCWMVLRELLKKAPPILDAAGGPDSLKPDWASAEGKNARYVVGLIFFVLFGPTGAVRRKEASAIADILFNLTKALGRIVHNSTGIDWAQALECSCADIPS
ncbi:hypothetical protein GGS24DRAFT_430739 [Hypoxylon argillaceum]|nr:hypothetical protein GGS24DRAFT_430739 [Hypoxylon argillaceum]